MLWTWRAHKEEEVKIKQCCWSSWKPWCVISGEGLCRRNGVLSSWGRKVRHASQCLCWLPVSVGDILWDSSLFKTHQRALIAQVPCKYPGIEFHLLQFPNDWKACPSFVMLWKLEQTERIPFSTHKWNLQLGFLKSTKKSRSKAIFLFQQEK